MLSNVTSPASNNADMSMPPGTAGDPLYSIVALPVTNAVNVSPMSASWTLSVPVIGPKGGLRNGSGGNVVDLECV